MKPDTAVIALIVTIIGLVLTNIFAVLSHNRNTRNDVTEEIERAKQKAADNAVMRESLNSIKADTSETRAELKSLRNDLSDYSSRLVVVEQSTKSAHHRIDRIDDVLSIPHRAEIEVKGGDHE